MKRQTSLAVSLLLILTLVFTACTSKSAEPSGTTSSNAPSSQPSASDSGQQAAQPKQGGILKYYVRTFNVLGYPASMTAAEGWNSAFNLETLFRFDKDGSLIPHLAKSYEASSANKTLTIKLNEGIKFHDGTDFNAEAVKWNLDTYKGAGKPELVNVSSIDVIDNYTLVLNFSTYDSTVLSSLTGNAGRIISPTAVQKNGKDWAEQNPVGTGPFKFESAVKDVVLKYSRFDEYWGGKPNLDGVEMIYYKDLQVAKMDFEAGNLDIITVADPISMKEIDSVGKYNTAYIYESIRPALIPSSNNPNSPFSKLEVRQALAYAIDQKTLAQSIGLGYFEEIYQFAFPNSWSFNPDIQGYPYNPQKAKELLAQAGYPNGFDTTLTYHAYNNTVNDQAVALQQMLKEVGINVTLNPMNTPAVQELMVKGWDGLIRTFFTIQPDPLQLLANFATGKVVVSTEMPDEFVQLAAQAVADDSEEGKQKAVRELNKLFTDKYAVFAFLPIENAMTAKSQRLKDDEYGITPNRWLNPQMWLDQ